MEYNFENINNVSIFVTYKTYVYNNFRKVFVRSIEQLYPLFRAKSHNYTRPD